MSTPCSAHCTCGATVDLRTGVGSDGERHPRTKAAGRTGRAWLAALSIGAMSEERVRDEAQGLCFFCGEGYEAIPGPRGGRPRTKHTNRHGEDCPYVTLRALRYDPDTLDTEDPEYIRVFRDAVVPE